MDATENGLNRVVCRSPWSKPVTVWLKLGLPFGFECQFDQRLPRALFHNRNSKRSLFGRAWFGYPDPANWRAFWNERRGVELGGKPQTLGRSEAFDPIYSGSMLALVVLSDPPHGQQTGPPGSHQQSL